jgi:dipeptidyl aminopeptidase/acylaminoacyl peptidase
MTHPFRSLRARGLAAAALSTWAATLAAQAPSGARPAAAPGARRPLTQADYDVWRSVQGASLSRDGRWMAYTLSPVVGDAEVVVRATAGATEYRTPRGLTGRPITTLGAGADSPFVAPPAQFSADGRIVAVLTYPTQAEMDAARRERRRGAAQPRNALAIIALADGRVTAVPRVRSFSMPRHAGGHLAYLLDAADSVARGAPRDSAAAPAGAAAAVPGGAPRPVSGDTGARRERRKEFGSTLVIRDVASGGETRVEDVVSYAFADSGRWLAYTVSSRAPERDGAYVRSLANGREHALLAGRGNYRALGFDQAGRQLAFLSDRDEYAAAKPRYTLYHARLAGTPVARAVVPAAAVERGLQLGERTASFVRDGTAIVVGLTSAPLDSIPADSLADKAVFDLWHYQEPRLQPQQQLDGRRERGRAYTAVYQLGAGRMVRLGDDTLPQVTVSDNGRVALANTSVPYAVEQMWGDGGNDVYLLDATTGRRTKIAARVPFGATLSPSARYVTYFDEGRWFAHDVVTGRRADLTGRLTGVRFDQETWDTPSEPAPWGIAGWTPGDRSLLVNSRYDVWEIDPAGVRPARVVTDSAGIRSGIRLRLLDVDAEERYVDPAKPLLLTAFDETTKASGFYRDRLGASTAPERIVMGDRRHGAPIKARGADVYALSVQTYAQAPDYYVGTRLDSLTRVTNANPQQAQYRWGTAELVAWKSTDGVPLQGVLYKPEGFDPTKQYPMVVYFYESLSDNLHQYHAPAGRNTINPTVYASHDYLVFFPDIAYTTGYPGQSAMSSILPGVQSLIAKGYVDEKAVGIAGQSWGGYQVAYMITQTPFFAAAFSGAPVANMTSAYGGIRWESGNSRASQYEHGQSRIGGSIWQTPLRYIENSPLFYVDRVRTPVLIMSNDADGAVPWYQGIELFVGLRRFGKEAYLLNYNGDGHNPRKRANQKDVDMRMQQFFAHHLRGERAPEWMQKGIPFLQKGRDQLAPAITTGAQPE